MKRILFFMCVLLPFIGGCTGQNSSSDAVSARDASDWNESAPARRAPRHQPADHQVIVMLGPDYTARPFALDGLLDEYGLVGNGGMTLRLLYPESFMDGDRPRLSLLLDHASDPRVTIIVAIGAPKGTLDTLSKIREARPEMRIVSLFQTEDPLTAESVSDLMIDYSMADELLADESTAAAIDSSVFGDSALGMLLLAAVLAEENPSGDSPLIRLSANLETARTLMRLKKDDFNFSVSAYADPDTGLNSRNHLILVPREGATN